LTINSDATHVSDAGFQDFWRLVNLRRLTLEAPLRNVDGLAVLAECPQLEKLQLRNETRPYSDDEIQRLKTLLTNRVEVTVR